MSHRLEVVGVNASLDSAEMVQLKTFGDGPIFLLIEQAVDILLLAFRTPDSGVAIAPSLGTLPFPATCLGISNVASKVITSTSTLMEADEADRLTLYPPFPGIGTGSKVRPLPTPTLAESTRIQHVGTSV
jgi:hypothetical protein